ncbi:DUF87 domain-containing protein [Ruminococcus sp.]|uniref:helicase HerA domain-containing protein n=1 Tax=Ruminococcus sp. TaxID=41978 RepID=UPI0025D8503C|nr:DUF87 domain-containing protein [Ruminococcus sp.]MCR4638488.1 DUF87 domain-containing protein [Ruminococcus sp.]
MHVLNNNGLLAGMGQFNTIPVNNLLGQNNTYISPLSSYGYAYGEPYSGNASPAPDVTINQTSYKLDGFDRWCLEIANNKGKVKSEPITGGFNIICQYKNKDPDGELRFVILQYQVKDKIFTTMIPQDDYIKDSFHKYLKEIFKYPGCTKSKFNNLISFLLQTVTTQDILMFPHQGWNATENGELIFAFNTAHLYIPHFLLAPSVQRRKLAPLLHSTQEICQNWLNIYANNSSLQFIGLYRIGSLFQRLFIESGLDIKQFLIAEPSEGLTKDKLKAMLATNDIDNFPIPTLSSSEDKIEAERDLTYDGIALYIDDCFVDDEKKMTSGIKSIIKSVRKDAINYDKGNGLTAVISQNAAYIATRLACENVVVINTDGIRVEAAPDEIKAVNSEMDALIVLTISSHLAEIKSFIGSVISNCRKNMPERIQGESLDTITMLIIVNNFFRQFLGFNMLNEESLEVLIQTVDCKSDRIMDSCNAIECDFSRILSKMIRSQSIRPVIKCRNMTFDNDGKSFIVDGNCIYIPNEIVEAVLSQMTTTHNLDNLMRALNQTKALESKDGNTHPVKLHTSSGEFQRLYLYNISAEILDADVLYKINNPESESFLLCKDEIPQEDFLTILNDGNGRVAGKQICYRDEENGHFYITGQSGWGKSYLLAQLLAKCFMLGHRVVVFDSSDSFSYKALCRNLSKSFVDNYVTIYDLDKEGIPINLFEIDYNASLPTKKKTLLGILQAGIGELSPPQSNALRMILSEVITELGNNGRITCDLIINKLNGINKELFTPKNVKDYLEPLLNELEACGYNPSELEKCDRNTLNFILRRLNGGGKNGGDATLGSLLNRIEPLFEDIESCGMADRTWNRFLAISKKITIIRTDSAYTESGNQLIDMMLATLYNYQHDNPQIALDVFIDELQNQNFSKTSPIRKVMKEGRKSHMSFFGATQDYYAHNTDLGSVMGKAGTLIFLRPTPNSAIAIASELHFNKAAMQRFDSMERGDIIVKSNLFSKNYRRNVPTVLSGHVDDYPKIPDNYYGNVL